jgi:chromosome segregation ATPase
MADAAYPASFCVGPGRYVTGESTMIARKSFAFAVLGIASLAALPASAQVRSSTTYNPNSNQNSATAQAGKQVNEARQNVQKIEQQIAKIKTRLRAQLLAKPEFTSINAEFKRAQKVFDDAKKQALALLHNKPEYQAMVKEREEAMAKRDAAGSGGAQVSDEELNKANDTIFKDGQALKKMEDRTLADDAKYQDAKAKLDAAKSKVDEVDNQVTEALKNDAEYQQELQSLDQAKQQLDQARQQLAQAAQQEQQQREQAAKSRSQSTGAGSGGRGR